MKIDELLSVVLRDSNDAIIVSTPEGKITVWNKGAEKLYGYSENEAKTMMITSTIVPEEKKLEMIGLLEKINSCEQVESYETTRKTKDGRILDVWATLTAVKDDHRIIGIASTERNVTERKRIEQELKRLAVVTRDSNDAIMVFTPEGKITAWNKAAERIYGYKEDEAKGMMVISTIVPEEKKQEMVDILAKIVNGEQIDSFETTRLTKNGRALAIWMTITAIKEDRKIVSFATTERDITYRKEYESTLLKKNEELASANKELESFSYSVSHDLRAPLMTIGGFAKLLKEDCSGRLDAECLDYVEKIESGINKMRSLIDDMLALSKVGRHEIVREHVDLSTIVHNILQELAASEPDRRAEFQIQEGLSADSDPRLTTIALNNILRNAWKFSSKNDVTRIQFGTIERDGKMFFYVRDNGVGFNMKTAEQIFEPFKRLHSDKVFAGTGIGLSIVKRIIDRHGGRIWAEGEEGKGATFYFSLR